MVFYSRGVKNPAGNDMEELTELIRQGKLIIGSWYTQTDEMVVGGESIVRNLLYGKWTVRHSGQG
ncbi:hypothetical protein C823_001262 [Eubacterium plexicaudatum ASF492]|nr:hypothetical protein C823_001262 [Eubacterium plexicaudatum ASF492]